MGLGVLTMLSWGLGVGFYQTLLPQSRITKGPLGASPWGSRILRFYLSLVPVLCLVLLELAL